MSNFNSSELEEKRKHLTTLFRGEPDIPYDKVSASDTHANSTFHQDLNYINKIRDATNFEMKRIAGTSRLHVYATMKDGSRQRIGSLNHRTDGGNYRIDSNALSDPPVKKTKSNRRRSLFSSKSRRQRSANTPKITPTNSFGSVDHGHVIINPLQ